MTNSSRSLRRRSPTTVAKVRRRSSMTRSLSAALGVVEIGGAGPGPADDAKTG